MSVSRYVCSVVHLAARHVLPSGGDGTPGAAPHSVANGTDDEAQRAPSLLLALGLATSLHILLFLALTAQPGVRRGVDAAFIQVELWPAFQAEITAVPAAAVPEPDRPEPPGLEASDAEVAIERNAAAPQKPVEPEQKLPEQPAEEDKERAEQPAQTPGCLGPEEMTRLEQARRGVAGPSLDGQEPGVGVPCVEG